jgi:hypothetical protein
MVGDNVKDVFRVLGTFPYMVVEAVLNIKTAIKYGKNRKKIKIVGDDVEWCFQGPWYISIYGS